MKKRISLLAVLLALVFALSGCSESSEADYDKETLISQADALISSFSQMSSEELDAFKDVNELQLNLTLLQSGSNVDAANFTTMIDAWEAGVEECGDYVEHDDFKVEESSGSIMLTSDAKYKDRDAEITIEFSEDSKMLSFTASAKYTMGEILKKAGLNTVLGMGTVFVVLIFISFIISLFGLIGKTQRKKTEPKQAEVLNHPEPEETEASEETAEDLTDDLELAAVITAAIAASEGTSTDGFVVRSIKKRRKNSQWK